MWGAVVAIISLAIVSVMTLMARSMPARDGKAELRARSARALDQIADELSCAASVGILGLHEIEFTVPDRDKDGQPETLRYVWSGRAGDPLHREYNGSSAVFLSAASDFTLGCDTESRSITVLSGSAPGPEVLLSSYPGPASGSYSFGVSNWASQYFVPELPADAISFSVTRVRFQMRRSGLIGLDTLNLQLRRAKTDTTPSATILASWTQASLGVASSYNWFQYSTSSVTGLAPGTGLCIVFSGAGLLASSELPMQSSGVPDARASLSRTGNAGLAWTVSSDAAILYEVYGMITRPAPLSISEGHARSFTVTLGAGTEASEAVTTTVASASRPVVPLMVLAPGEEGESAAPAALK
jgi:hypothetical protein